MKQFLIAIVLAGAWEAKATLYTWQFNAVTGSPATGQISSTDPNFPFDAIGSPTPPAVSSAVFFIGHPGLEIDLTAALNTAFQIPGGAELVPALAPDGGSGLGLGPFQGYAPAFNLAGVMFTLNPSENEPNAPDPQQWQYTGSSGTLSGTGYWELAAVPEPSLSALFLSSIPAFRLAVRRRKKTAA